MMNIDTVNMKVIKAHYRRVFPVKYLLALCIGMCLSGSRANAQWDQYRFERPLSGIEAQWHRVELPDDLFGQLRLNYADLRIMGLSETGDTIEAPYLLQLPRDRKAIEKTAFRLLNPGTRDGTYFVSLEQLSPQVINRIQLNFANKNFDWPLKLEGSNDQQEWFTIKEAYRILDIENELTDYTFSTLHFPDSKYQFYRIAIPGAEGATLQSATSSHQTVQEEAYRNYKIIKQQISENTKAKRTELELTLSHPVPVSALRLEVTAEYDYYRPVTIEVLTDSTITETDTTYFFEQAGSGIISSLEEPVFHFSPVRTHRLKILIHHHDNAPLSVSDVSVQGRPPTLVALFTEPGNYVLRYGWPEARAPRYDLARFSDKIPDNLSVLSLGEEVQLRAPETASGPLLASKWWLWGILILAVGVLGWFAFNMLRS